MGRIEYWLLGAVAALIVFIAVASAKSSLQPRRYALQVEQTGQSRDVVFSDVKSAGDTVTFTEAFEYQGNAVPITYTGVVVGNEIRFVRKVADFATESFVAKRQK